MSSVPPLASNADSLQPSDFWDALAPHHAAIEDNYLDRASLRLLAPEIQEPVLVVGAGQGLLLLRTWAFSTRQEKVMVARMQRMFRRMNEPSSLLKTAPEQQPYRNEQEIRKLFQRLKLPLRELRRFSSCHVVKL